MDISFNLFKDVSHYKSRKIQTDYTDHETQTDPWSPPILTCVHEEGAVPEVLLMDHYKWGHNIPFDFYDAKLLNSERKRRDWNKLLASGVYPPKYVKAALVQLGNDEFQDQEKQLDLVNEERMRLADLELKEQRRLLLEKRNNRIDKVIEHLKNLVIDNQLVLKKKLNKEIRLLNNRDEGVQLRYGQGGSLLKKYLDKTSDVYIPPRRFGYVCKYMDERIAIDFTNNLRC